MKTPSPCLSGRQAGSFTVPLRITGPAWDLDVQSARPSFGARDPALLGDVDMTVELVVAEFSTSQDMAPGKNAYSLIPPPI